MYTLDVQLTAEGLLAAWRPQSGHLVLDTPHAPRLGSRLAARLRLEGTGFRAAVLGAVGSRLHAGTGHRIELVPDPAGLAALKLLVSAAQGRPVRFQDRAPRVATCLPAVLREAGALRYMDTLSISREGCQLRWRGHTPATGALVSLRIGAGPLAANLDGVVRWVGAAHVHAHATVGVALLGAAARVGWLRWLELAQETGALF